MPEDDSLEEAQPTVTSSDPEAEPTSTLEEALSENSDAISYVSAPETQSELATEVLEGMAKPNTLTRQELSKAEVGNPRSLSGSESCCVVKR